MTPLERLHIHLGAPAWYWHAVLFAIFLLWGLAGFIAPEIEL